MMAAVFGDHDTEVRADFIGSGKQIEHFRWNSGGGDVEILRFMAEQAVAHAAAGEEGLMAG